MSHIYTVLDLETTGFSTSFDNILEVGYLQCLSDMTIFKSGSFYFWKDGWRMGGQNVHGLSVEFMQRHEADFDDSLAKLYALFNYSILVGKNSDRYDIPMMTSFLWRNCSSYGNVTPRATLDLQKHFKNDYQTWYWENVDKRGTGKTGTLAEQCLAVGITPDDITACYRTLNFNPERDGFHSALYDVAATYLLLKYAVEVKKCNIAV